MTFKAYYDGSGKSDLPATTLTGVAAPEEVWERFEPLWVDALDRNAVPDRDFHMADLMGSHGHFEDWDAGRRQALLTDLFNVFGRFRTDDMAAYSCTVFFEAYDQARQLLQGLRKPARICVDYCVGSLQLTEEQLAAAESRPIFLYFDRNEDFMHTINHVWLKHKKSKTGWPSQIGDIITADRSDYPIQAADMLGWIVNRNRLQAVMQRKPQPYQRLVFANHLNKYECMFFQTWFMVSHHMKWYDDPQQIIERYPTG